MKLYHATTQKKAKLYRQTGHIIAPVRGFTTLQGAMAWAMKVGRTVIYEVECEKFIADNISDYQHGQGKI